MVIVNVITEHTFDRDRTIDIRIKFHEKDWGILREWTPELPTDDHSDGSIPCEWVSFCGPGITPKDLDRYRNESI